MAVNDMELSAEDLKVLDEMRNAPAEPEAQETPAAETPKAVESAPPAGSAVEQKQEQLRKPDGKFAAKEAEKPAEQPKPAEAAKPEGEERSVPLGALKEEREKRQALQRELDQYRGSVEERLRAIREQITKPAEPKKTVEEAPIEALKETRQQVEQLTQAQQQAFQRQQFATHVSAQVRDFRSKTEDYDAAYKHLREGRVLELSALGYAPMQIEQVLESDEFNIAALALQQQKNPGEVLYRLAESRGYKKAQPAEQRAQAAATAAKPAEPTALEKLATMEKGQAASKSLSAGGAAPAASLTLERLAEMTPDQLAKLSDDEFRRVMGG